MSQEVLEAMAAKLLELEDQIEQLAVVEGLTTEYSARISKNATNTANTSTDTEVTMQVQDFNNNLTVDLANNRITIPDAAAAGRYLIIAHASFSSNANNRRFVKATVNGGFEARIGEGNPGGTAYIQCAVPADLASGDHITVTAWQDSGATLTLLAEAFLSVHRIG
jgi:hypothetical protein